MADNNMDKLKKIIEEKKAKSLANDPNVRPDRTLGGKSHKAFDNKKSGGSSNNKV